MVKTAQEHRLEDRFVSAFEMNVGRTLNGTNEKLQQLRRRAIDRFDEIGFPSTKHEGWRYTNIADVLKRTYSLQLTPPASEVTRSEISALLVPDLDADVVVLVNGRYSDRLSTMGELPEGVVVAGLHEAAERHPDIVNRHLGRYANFQDDVFTALNTAFALHGLFIYLPKRCILERPIHIVNLLSVGEDAFLQPRHLFVFEEASQARIIESSHVSAEARTMTNSVAEIYAGKRSVVDMFLIQDEGEHASAITNTHVYQDEASVFSVHTLTLSGDVVRNNLTVVPNAEFCETHLYGLFMPTGSTHVDNHTLVDHASPNCVSNELYKGVLDDSSSGVFNGKVFVRRDAQKINAFQENKTILLTGLATMNSKPELEIYADDVKCSHGATTGQLDKEALFYLRSRGIPARQAQGMLLHAFVGDVLEKISVKPLRDAIDRRVSARFGW